MKRPQVTNEMKIKAGEAIGSAMEYALLEHGHGAFKEPTEIIHQVIKQTQQLVNENFNKGKGCDKKEFAKQLAQIGQLSYFGLASMETWEGEKNG